MAAGPLRLGLAVAAVAVLAAVSLFVGVSDIGPLTVVSGRASARAMMVMAESRLPRTLALLLAGAGMAIAGLIMQIMVRNRFVEPTVAGTTEAARLGMLTVLILAPGLALPLKMAVAAVFALAGTGLFLGLLQRLPLRDVLTVPLAGIMLGGVLNAVTAFIAYRLDMMQAMAAWSGGDFSAVVRGRYEILWAGLVLTGIAYVIADRFTVAGLGRDFALGLGLDYRTVMFVGMTIVALVSAAVVVTVGVVPFLGLIVPNLVSRALGDNLRRALPWTAVCGAGLLVACDILGRSLNPPFEVPVGVVLGAFGSLAFIALLVRGRARVA